MNPALARYARRTEGERAERQLIMLSAATRARRDAMSHRARDLMRRVDWQKLAGTLSARRLLPILGPRMLEMADKGCVGEEFEDAVEQAIIAGRRQSAFLLLVCERLGVMLAEAGIASAPLKGPQLGALIYGDSGRRLSGDIDILVSPDDLSSAVAVARTLGYEAPTDPLDREGLPLLHLELLHERGELPPVELHWRVHWYERRFARERLLPTEPPDAGWRPAPVDELTSLLLFYARDGFVDLRLAADLSAWWDVFGESLPANALTQVIETYPSLSRPVVVAAAVAERVVGLPAAELLGGLGRLGPRDRLAARLANPNPASSQSQLSADTGLVDGLLTPPGGLAAFVKRQVLLPKEVLDRHAQRAPEWTAKSPADYSLRVLLRYGLSLARAIRSPEGLGGEA